MPLYFWGKIIKDDWLGLICCVKMELLWPSGFNVLALYLMVECWSVAEKPHTYMQQVAHSRLHWWCFIVSTKNAWLNPEIITSICNTNYSFLYRLSMWAYLIISPYWQPMLKTVIRFTDRGYFFRVHLKIEECRRSSNATILLEQSTCGAVLILEPFSSLVMTSFHWFRQDN